MKKIFEKYSNKKTAVFAVMLLFAWMNFSWAEDDELNFFEDQDQDGLADQEEQTLGTDPAKADTDGDGYSDGVEVEGGYDPLVPAPGDRIVEGAEGETESEINLTEAFFEKLKEEKKEELDFLQQKELSGEGALDVEEDENLSLTEDEIEALVNQTIEESGISNDEMELVSEEELNIADEPEDDRDETKKQIEEYLVGVGYIFLSNAPFEVADVDDAEGMLSEFGSYFSETVAEAEGGDTDEIEEVKDEAQGIFEELTEIEVPYEMKDIHIVGMSLLQYLMGRNEQALFGEEDPLEAMMLIGELEAATSELESLGEGVEDILNEYEIESLNVPQEMMSSLGVQG